MLLTTIILQDLLKIKGLFLRRTKADSTKQSYVEKVEVYPTKKQARYLDGQSKILNWLRNALVDQVNGLMSELSNKDKPCSPERVKEILNQVYSPTGVRDMVPNLKEKYPFLRKVHSSPLKNVAFGVTQAIKAHQKKQRTGSGVAGWCRHSKWSSSWTSIFYEEVKGWKIVSKGSEEANSKATDQAKSSTTKAEAEAKAAKTKAAKSSKVVVEAEAKKKNKSSRIKWNKRYLQLSFGKLQDGTKLGELIEVERTPANLRKAKNVRIVKEGKRFYAVFLFEKNKPACTSLNTEAKSKGEVRAIFLDPNHKSFAYGVGTDGAAYEFETMMRDIKTALKSVDYLQKRRDKCKKDSKKIEYYRGEDNSIHYHYEASKRWKMYDRLRLEAWRKLREKKNQFQGSLANFLCQRYEVIGIGDYVPVSADHGRGRKFNRSVVNNTFHAQFKSRLKWVVEKSGRTYVEVDEKGTTRTCHACGYIVEGGLDPSIRNWRCCGCGLAHIRDENAAINGLNRLQSLLGFSHLPSLGHQDIVSRRIFRYHPEGWSEIEADSALRRK